MRFSIKQALRRAGVAASAMALAVCATAAFSTTALADEAALTIYEKASADATPVEVAAYTQDELTQLATTSEKGLTYQFYKGGAWQAVNTTMYVTFDDLFDDAGIEVDGVDTVTAAAADGFSRDKDYYTMSNGYTYLEDTNADSTSQFSSNRTAVAPVLALTYGQTAPSGTDSIATAAATVEQSTSSCPKLLYGISKNDHNADNAASNCAGNRLVGSVNSITITRGTYLTVNFCINSAAEPTVLKTFTKDDLEELATSGSVSVQYGGSNDRSTWSTKTSTNYVTLTDLFEELGFTPNETTQITATAVDGFSYGPTSWTDMCAGVYYPKTDSTEGMVNVKPALALTASTNGSAETNNGCAVLFTGVTDTSYAGKRLIGSVNSLTIVSKVTPDTSAIKFANKTATYTGKAISIAATGVPSYAKVNYMVTCVGAEGAYQGNSAISAGTYKVTANFTVDEDVYTPIAPMTATLTIKKAAQSSAKISTAATKTVKKSAVKKAAKKIALAKKGVKDNAKVTWSKVSGSKKISVKSGKLVVKKGTKKGTYKVKVKLTIKATSNYAAKTITKTIKVKVK